MKYNPSQKEPQENRTGVDPLAVNIQTYNLETSYNIYGV